MTDQAADSGRCPGGRRRHPRSADPRGRTPRLALRTPLPPPDRAGLASDHRVRPAPGTGCPCDIIGERAAGAAITLPFWPGHVEKYAIDEPTLTGRIEIWEPPRRFGWTWGGDLLIFELTAVADETDLVFTTWPEDPDLAGIVSSAGSLPPLPRRARPGGAGHRLRAPDDRGGRGRVSTRGEHTAGSSATPERPSAHDRVSSTIPVSQMTAPPGIGGGAGALSSPR